jgi:TPR repeat protein
MAFNESLLSRGSDTVRAANSGDADSQAELGSFHFMSALRLDMLQGAPADDHVVAARWVEALRFTEMAAEQGVQGAQGRCGLIYAIGGRSVPQNWTAALKWWRKAAEAGGKIAQWFVGQCYYYGRGEDRDVEQAKVWFRKAAAQGYLSAIEPAQSGIPGEALREDIVRFTNAGSATVRLAVAHEFAEQIH